MSAPIKFHVSLNVSDLARSVAFYRTLLGVEPARSFDDYAKFEMPEPPLVLSLQPNRASPGGNLNHLGLRLPDSAALVRCQCRLESAGIKTQREEGVACCHSCQTKFWMADPDGALWEIYILDEEKDERPKPASGAERFIMPAAPRLSWRHDLPDPFPRRIAHEDNWLHEVALEGTANLAAAAAGLDGMLAEVYRVLRPGGQVALHGLAGDRPFNGAPLNLPGPAAKVEHVPVETEPPGAMSRAGFVQVRFEKLSAESYFDVGGVKMREILLTGRKPGHRPAAASRQAVYLGPLARVEDDFGNVFPRGHRVALNIHDWQSLSQSSAAGTFLFLPAEKGAQG
ncbi:MAG TPA: ArsI/CadI family heavy metal resistance metalloenzyme [Verrucomicrobiae bacterium]|jgi:catechol 2,3-dioxygenase-like lactoylglutathione lyase family enzyme